MTYELEFDSTSLARMAEAWRDGQKQFKNKLQQDRADPRIESTRLSDLPDCYKIKLKASGYRLVYQVRDSVVVVYVIAIGKEESGRLSSGE